ncbi:MAG: hypothetical protein BWX59_02255 [Bacteroidetes bacterium ADurb.Bin028]|nr:MAG: hypothetical protein BWX59_02255 [Bacteroidetes bacterium ADurb.Bin028]
MSGGLFITLYDEPTLALYLRCGIYGFLMKPVIKGQPSSRSKHYDALADYACSREGTHVFFFLKRKIIYGGRVNGNIEEASFYLNGETSPLGRNVHAPLFWDESLRYIPTVTPGVFQVNGIDKAQPFILQFTVIDNLTGKQISSDDLYFELGKYSYPLPSNSIQGMGFCTLTPGETEIALDLLNRSEKKFNIKNDENIGIGEKKTLFSSDLIQLSQFINEANLEFNILTNLKFISELIPDANYVLCRQVPISPFKPFNIDRADICLYNKDDLIKNGTIPNIIIELKKDKANFHAYNQISNYLKWLEKITNEDEFNKITPIIVAKNFNINKRKIEKKYYSKIKCFSIETNQAWFLPE